MADFIASEYAGRNEPITFTQLTATSTGTGAIDLRTQDRRGIYKNVNFHVTVASIATNVEVILQGSLDNVNWANLCRDEGTEKWTSDGTYSILYEGKGEINYIRGYFYAESGTSTATIDMKAKIFGKPEILGSYASN